MGYSCDPPSPTPWWYVPGYNFTYAWLMVANPDGVSGLAQGGFFRFNEGAITTAAETNTNGSGPTRRFYPAVTLAGVDHRYTVDYQIGCHCIAIYIDGVLALSADFDPIALWEVGRP